LFTVEFTDYKMKFLILLAFVALAGANLAPEFIAPTPMATNSGSSTFDIPVCIGGEVKLTLKAADQGVSSAQNTVVIALTKYPSDNDLGVYSVSPTTMYDDENNKSVGYRVITYRPKHSIDNFENDEQICFTASDNNSGEGTGSTSSGEKCVNIVKRYYPLFMDKTPAADEPFLTYINHEVTFTVQAQDLNEYDGVKIMVDEDPGLPNGAVVETQTCGAQQIGDTTEEGSNNIPCNPASRVFKWTPIVGQEGPVPGGTRSYRVCFHIRDDKDSCAIGGYYNPEQRCVNIMVQAPEEEWIGDTPEEDQVFQAHASRTMPGGGRSTDHHNCEVCYDMETHSKEGKYLSEIFQWSTTVTPPGPATSSYTYRWKPAIDEQHVSDRSFTHEDEENNHLVQPNEEGGTLPQGASLTHIPNKDPGEGEDKPTSSKKKFCWKPVRGQEARSYRTCYSARDEHHIDGPARTTRCVIVEVVRCKYCTQPGETLLNIAVDYNTDWLQLWGANVDVKNPDSLLDFQILNVGPIYHVREGDSLDSLAARFHTTPDEILSVNPDVEGIDGNGEDHDLHIGQNLCVMPGICTFTEYHLQRD
jgi:hypothetical protein